MTTGINCQFIKETKNIRKIIQTQNWHNYVCLPYYTYSESLVTPITNTSFWQTIGISKVYSLLVLQY